MKNITAPTRQFQSFTAWRLSLIGVFLISVAFYLRSFQGQPIWDDHMLISGEIFGGNTVLAALTHPFATYFRPLTALSFVLDTSYCHGNPFFYHQTNVLLHSFAAVLVSCLAFVVTNSRKAGIFAGVFFASQAMQVGAVGWIGGRTDALSSLFLAAFLLTLVQHIKTSGRLWLVVSVLSLLLAALSKEQAIAALPAVPLAVLMFGSRRWKDALTISAPFLVMTVLYLGLWQRYAPFPHTSFDPLPQGLALAFQTIAFYGTATVLPNSAALQSYTLHNFQGVGPILIGIAYFMLLLALVVWLWKRSKPLAWLVITGILVYLPIGNFPPSPSFAIGPYRLAESGVAIACLLGISLSLAVSHKKYLLALPIVANLILSAWVTFAGVNIWLTSDGAFRSIVRNDPHFLAVADLLAESLNKTGQSPEAARVLDVPFRHLFQSDAWPAEVEAKGKSIFTTDVQKRLREMGGAPNPEAIAIDMGNYAFALARTGRAPKAKQVARAALRLSPNAPTLNYMYGRLLLRDDRAEAIRHWEHALQLAPDYPQCAASLAHERLLDHRYSDVIDLVGRALPRMGYDGQVWLDLSDAQDAVHNYGAAMKALEDSKTALFQPSPKAISDRQQRISSEVVTASHRK
jgi:tetratricopeptide (TPR) repeat protein